MGPPSEGRCCFLFHSLGFCKPLSLGVFGLIRALGLPYLWWTATFSPKLQDDPGHTAS